MPFVGAVPPTLTAALWLASPMVTLSVVVTLSSVIVCSLPLAPILLGIVVLISTDFASPLTSAVPSFMITSVVPSFSLSVSTFSSSPKTTLAPLKMAIVAIESINLLFVVIRLPFIKMLNPLCSRLRNLCEIANSSLNFVIASKTNAINLVILSESEVSTP